MDGLSFKYDEHKKQLVFDFPKAVISTNVDELRLRFSEFTQRHIEVIGAEKITEWTDVLLDFSNTRVIDSLGLNLVVQVLHWLKQKQVNVCAIVKSGIIRLVFLNVRLNQQMKIVFTGTPLEGIDEPVSPAIEENN